MNFWFLLDCVPVIPGNRCSKSSSLNGVSCPTGITGGSLHSSSEFDIDTLRLLFLCSSASMISSHGENRQGSFDNPAQPCSRTDPVRYPALSVIGVQDLLKSDLMCRLGGSAVLAACFSSIRTELMFVR